MKKKSMFYKRIRTNSEEEEERSKQGIMNIKKELPDGKAETQKIIKTLNGIDQAKNLTIAMLQEKDKNIEFFEQVFMCKICY
jgi:hypothetical protein